MSVLFDEKRREDVERALLSAYRFENETVPYFINDVNYWLFGEVAENVPDDYCGLDPESMISFQTSKIERHTREYEDSYIPFLMPWYGTGVLASAFGVPVVFPPKMDPAVDMARITDVKQIDDLRLPDFTKDGLAPRVLNAIRAMRKEGLPVGVTDCQGPLTTALQVVGYDKIIYWMYDYPDSIHRLMGLVTEALIEWVRLQKGEAGQLNDDGAYILGMKIPSGYGGVWMADDDSVIFNNDLYDEFVRPYNSRVLKAFGGGCIHYCGNSNQNIPSYLKTEGLNGINNFALGDLEAAAKARQSFKEAGKVYMLCDFNVSDNSIEDYYAELFRKMGGTKGLIVGSYIAPAVTLDHGRYNAAKRDPAATGKAIEAAIRRNSR